MQKISYKNLELNPFTLIGEEKFLLTAGTLADWNTMTAAWGGLGYLWNKPVVFTFVRESRYTLEYLEKNTTFSLSFFPTENKKILDYCGSHSGRVVDKAEATGLKALSIDNTVSFSEANLIFTCKKLDQILIDKESMLDRELLKNYPQGDWHYMIVGELEGVYIN